MSDERDYEEVRSWILARYGPIETLKRKLVVFTVPIKGGRALGVGLTKQQALNSLLDDLKGRNEP